MSKTIFKNREIETLITDIRAEASTQKECITRYTIQTLIFAGALWAIAFGFDTGSSTFRTAVCGILCGVLVSCVTFIVSRMANHKYHTVNRNYGYELHLYRLKDYAEDDQKREWNEMMLQVGWEEAMCSVRVVQATLFNSIYSELRLPLKKWIPFRGFLDLHWLFPFYLQRKHRAKPSKTNSSEVDQIYAWYDTHRLINNDYDYHPGSYLRNIHVILHSVGFLSIGLVWGLYIWACNEFEFYVWDITSWDTLFSQKGMFCSLFLLFNVPLFIAFVAQWIRQRSFRQILQSGLCSIQSSAVVWRIVVTCHILAKECASHKNASYKLYTRYTYDFAKIAVKNLYRIHEWLREVEINHINPENMMKKYDELFPDEKKTKYLEWLPGYEPKRRADGTLDNWP